MSDNESIIMQFVEMTGSDPTTALFYLEMSNFDLESALNIMFSGDIPPPPESSQKTESRHEPFSFEDDFQDEDSVRVADPVKQQVLLDYSSHRQSQSQRLAMESNLAFSRAEDPSVEWMFPPPNHLSFPGTLAEARATAMKDQKWILVNIQCDKEFSSHLLNRDVWTNETLVSLIRMNFIFWQRGKTSQDGEMFVSIHHLSSELGGEGFPMIGIVDSRTGALITQIKVTNKTDANDLILKLMEFLEVNNLSDTHAPTVRPRSVSKSSPHTSFKEMNEDEDDDDEEEDILSLAAALKASMDLPPPPSPSQGQAYSSTATSEVAGTASISKSMSSPSLYNGITVGETAEPKESDGGVKVSLKLTPELVQAMATETTSSITKPPQKQSLIRYFHGQDQTVQHVYAAVHFLLQAHTAALPLEYQDRAFDLYTAFPRLSLDSKRDLSVSAAGLKGAQVIMQWL